MFTSRANEFVDLVRSRQVVVLAAETGAGKSTLAPLALLRAGIHGDKQIVVTQPRRPAAVNLAKWVSQLNGTPLGQEIGYQIGQDRKTNRDTQLVYMTEGILLNRLQSDPILSDYSIIVLDEVHERNVDQDLLIALIKRLLPQRPDLKVVVMSATINVVRFSTFFDCAPMLEIRGRTYPVEIRYATRSCLNLHHYIDEAVNKTVKILQTGQPGDILTFMPD